MPNAIAMRRLTIGGLVAAALIAAPQLAAADAMKGLFKDLGAAAVKELQNQGRGATPGAAAPAAPGAPGVTPAHATGSATPLSTQAPARGPVQAPDPRAHHLTWDTKFTATGLASRKLIGHDFLFYCPPAPSRLVPRRVTGTDRYAFHTVVCRAAVHAGRINMSGGNVTVRMLEGNMKLVGSTRNGIETKSGYSGIRTLVFVN